VGVNSQLSTWSETAGVSFALAGVEYNRGIIESPTHLDCSATNYDTERDISLILREQEWFIWTNT